MIWKLILLEELALAGAPFGPLGGADQTAEVIIRDGTPYLQSEVLPRIGRGEVTFWQGFSEPGAGSDLLSLTTEARRDGDDYVIRGHKIWSSHAGIADYGLVLARTSREARRSRGLTMLVVANTTPGMDIRPIRSLTGEVYHYEVFLDDVRVPADRMLGREGDGFQALLAGLDTDRFWGRFYKARPETSVAPPRRVRQWDDRGAPAGPRRRAPRPRRPRRRDRGAQAPLLPRGRHDRDG
jgi:alkylation response protein AidB-like acyl-CoA dehydrogenase